MTKNTDRGPSIDIFACPTRIRNGNCRCRPKCVVCGWGPHAALHGPLYGEPVGSPAYDHAYKEPV